MKTDRYSRRALLKRMGLSAAMMPLIHAERVMGAEPGGFPKRFVSVAHGNGVIANQFYPAAPGPLTTLPASLASLQPLAAKMNILYGLNMQPILDHKDDYDGHFTYGTTLTGTREAKTESRQALGPSIDQTISDNIAKTVTLKAPLLTLGVKSTGDSVSTSWRAAGQQNVAEQDPSRLFTKLFTGASMPPAAMAMVNLRQQSIVDFSLNELTAFGKRLGTEDRQKIQAHLESVRQLEKQIKNASTMPATSTANCTAPKINGGKTADFLAKDMFDMTALALKCDITRVVTITMFDDGGGDGNSFPWVGVNKDYHAVAHAGQGGAADKVKIDGWIYSNVANLATQLEATMEGNATALDNTVIATFSDMEDGSSHYVGRIPITLIGSAGGFFKTGRYIKYPATPHNKLLTSICKAMGLTVTGIGDAKYAGDLPDLYV